MKPVISHIVIVGSGNVAYHLLSAFRRQGLKVVQVLSRGGGQAKILGERFQVAVINDPAGITRDADLYVLAVRDDVIEAVASTLPIRDRLIVHTSGATPLEALSPLGSRTGVFYPLQSFTFGKDVDLRGIPLCIEASKEEDLELLRGLALKITGNAWALNSDQRLHLHLAAVFAANFTHRMYAIASRILDGQGIPFGILGPLIQETAAKAVYGDPRQGQTGPAVRKDRKIIDKHLAMLKGHPSYSEIYRLITKNIMNEQPGNEEL